MKRIKVIGFDADDTLWVNENYYRETEHRYAALLSEYGDLQFVTDQLYRTEMQNLKMFGYGVKPFMISMIENAITISNGDVSADIISKVLEMGREMLAKPIELLPSVKVVLEQLYGKYKLVVVTKGDLLDQERKLNKSSLSRFFHHIEIMSDKTINSYKALLTHLEIDPVDFVMIGNSMRSDIIPPYKLGCRAIHVPYDMTWQYEMDVEELEENDRFYKVEKLDEVLQILGK